MTRTTPEYQRRWRIENPDRHWDYTKRNKARALGVPWERVERREILERDGFLCGCCETPVDPDAVFPDRNYPSVVAVVSLKDPGTPGHVASNLKTYCLPCTWSVNGKRRYR